MNLLNLKSMLSFGVQDVAATGGLTLPSAHVLCSRCVKDGRFLRLKRDFYILAGNWEHYTPLKFMQIANRLQVPSYLSLTTALAYHQITTQVQRQWWESISTRRSTVVQAGGATFVYHKLQGDLYFGFTRQDGIFIAEPEKAILDAAYFEVLGHGAIDWDAIDRGKIDKERYADYLARFPERLRRRIRRKCRI